MIIVLDTSVLISGIFWKGPPNKVLEMISARQDIELAQSFETYDEFEKVINREKFTQIAGQRKLDIAQVLESLFTVSTFFLISRESKDKVGREIEIEDPDDLVFIELALEAGAEYIISGDPHLLKLEKYQNIKIVKPAEFLETLP